MTLSTTKGGGEELEGQNPPGSRGEHPGTHASEGLWRPRGSKADTRMPDTPRESITRVHAAESSTAQVTAVCSGVWGRWGGRGADPWGGLQRLGPGEGRLGCRGLMR